MESSKPGVVASAIQAKIISPLLALPLELRIQIYKELLAPDITLNTSFSTRNGNGVGKIYDLLRDDDQSAKRYGEVAHPESEQHEVEAMKKDKHGDTEPWDKDRSGVSTEATGFHGEDQTSNEATTSIEIDDYTNIDYGSAPPEPDCGWLQHLRLSGIDPTILCVNKQIHNEAVSILYHNIFCNIHVDRDVSWWWEDGYFLMQDYCRVYCVNEDKSTDCKVDVPLCTRYFNINFENQSSLKSHCLRWIPNITIDIEWNDLLTRPPCCSSSSPDKQHSRYELGLTSEGELILEILRCLNRTPAPGDPSTRWLHMTFIGDCSDICAQHYGKDYPSTGTQGSKLGATREEGSISEIIGLLRGLTNTRTVIVEEAVCTYHDTELAERYVEREVDLDTLTFIES